jgi:hypothetical protein
MRLQRESLAEQRRMNDAQLEFFARQTKALANTQMPQFRPNSPPPTPATAGSDQARMMMLMEAKNRYGFADTVQGGMRRGIGAAA